MFELTSAWWELPARATLIYAVLLVLVRVSGKRTVGQFTPFDLLVVMLLSESVSGGLNGQEQSVTGAVLAAATLISLNTLVAILTARNTRLQMLAEGSAVLIGRDGHFFEDTLRRCRIPAVDAERALREADCDLAQMRFAFLEADGDISILKKSTGAVRHQAQGHLHAR